MGSQGCLPAWGETERVGREKVSGPEAEPSLFKGAVCLATARGQYSRQRGEHEEKQKKGQHGKFWELE